MQNEYNKDPKISENASKTFYASKIIIDNIDGKYQNYFFKDFANNATYGRIENYHIKGMGGINWYYIGMINKDKQPHGWGRAVRADNDRFFDA